jgi:hypothetical protein
MVSLVLLPAGPCLVVADLESFLFTPKKSPFFSNQIHGFRLKLSPKFLPFVLLALAIIPRPCPAAPVDFTRDVQPLLNKHCAECHGGVKQKGGLMLTNRTRALEGGKSGDPLVVAGKPEESELHRRLIHHDPDEQMPPGEPLATEEISLIRDWIRQGARWPEHWAYKPIKAVAPPSVRNRKWPLNKIDHFILSRLEQNSIEPSPTAPPHVLLRRLQLDLVGLPPTIEELESFGKAWKQNPNGALEAATDRLLASPHFGERWGRHWLDQARYADSDGYEKDNPRPNAWLWRDWVIKAINEDMPFDRFTTEQLAGDLFPERTPQQQLATAFHRQTLRNREGGTDQEEDRVKRVIDRVATTSRTWLGLTLECAQCHDHPYDPATQIDFYRFYAFFNNADEGGVKIPLENGKTHEAQVMRRNGKRKTYLLQRGDFLQPDRKQGEIKPGGLSFLHPFQVSGAAPTRMDLARWLTNRDNPLMARVTANTIWLHLFGKGLSSSPENFGSQGNSPSHPALLDWLAHQFIQEGWSRKKLIRKIVTSQTYRQSSRHRPELNAYDPDNSLLHRQNRKRVEAEIIRDLHLSVSGLLAHRIGGSSVFPPIPPDVAAQSFANNFQWKVSKGPDRYRRGMYTFFKRTAPAPNLMTFDCPDSNTSVTRRNISNTPLMALTTLQNEVFHEAAQALARRIKSNSDLDTDHKRVDQLFLLSLSRRPSPSERDIVVRLLTDNRTHYRSHPEDTRKLCREDDFDLAAWTATVRIITNLDEFITCS